MSQKATSFRWVVIVRYDVEEKLSAASAATPEATESKAAEAPEPRSWLPPWRPWMRHLQGKVLQVVSTRHWFGALPSRRESAWLNWSKCLALVLKDV